MPAETAQGADEAGGAGLGAASCGDGEDTVRGSAFGKYDGAQLGNGDIKRVVDHGVLVVADAFKFLLGFGETPADDVFGGHAFGFAAVAQAQLEDLRAGRHDEDGGLVRDGFFS